MINEFVIERSHQTPIKRKRLFAIDGLRVASFVMIFIWHLNDILFVFPADIGTFAVEIFFVISGFCLVYSSIDKQKVLTVKSYFSFLWKKIKKIYPLHLFGFLLSCFLIAYEFNFTSFFQYIFTWNAFANLTLTQSWFHTSTIYFAYNGVSWFLSSLIFCFAVAPFLLLIIKKINKKSTVFIVMICLFIIKTIYEMIIRTYLFNKAGCFVNINPISKLIDFSIGMFACKLFILFNSNEKEAQISKQEYTLVTLLEIFIFLFFSNFCMLF